MVKKGDRVTIDGKTATVTGWWGQGKTRVFQLDDGRTVFDLHLLVEDGDATVSEETPPAEELVELATEHPEYHANPSPDMFWDEDEEDGQED